MREEVEKFIHHKQKTLSPFQSCSKAKDYDFMSERHIFLKLNQHRHYMKLKVGLLFEGLCNNHQIKKEEIPHCESIDAEKGETEMVDLEVDEEDINNSFTALQHTQEACYVPTDLQEKVGHNILLHSFDAHTKQVGIGAIVSKSRGGNDYERLEVEIETLTNEAKDLYISGILDLGSTLAIVANIIDGSPSHVEASTSSRKGKVVSSKMLNNSVSTTENLDKAEELKEEPINLALEEESANLDVSLFRAEIVVDEPTEDVPVTETTLTLVHLPSFHLNGKDYINLHSIQSLFNIREDYCLTAIAEASQVAKDFVDIEGESKEEFLALDLETSNEKFLEAPDAFEFCLKRATLEDVDFKARLVELGIDKFGRNVLEPDKINADLGAKSTLSMKDRLKQMRCKR
ncbi:hypothetical protein L7F22_005319 [Adiantum nelumboides]|nr:hypothetical protein [Adiantum nelumboides]